MLRSLRIENVAVFEQAELPLNSGFCVLTGETGAGKSILIDSLSAVLGGRTSRELVRQGCDKATITALFEDCSPAVRQKLADLGYSSPDDTLLLSRVITADGRSSCRMNGAPANTAVVRQLAVLLVNIHGQQDNHALLDPAGHGAFVDRLLQDPGLLTRYREAYAAYKALYTRYRALQVDEAEKARLEEQLRCQVEELTAAGLKPGEYEALLARRQAAEHHEKLAAALGGALALLAGDEETPGGVDAVEQAAGYVEECAPLLPLEGLSERLRSLQYELQAAADEVRRQAEDLSFDPREQEEVEQRLDFLYRLRHKYGKNEEELLALLEQSAARLQDLQRAEQTANTLAGELQAAGGAVKAAAHDLTKARRAAAAQLDEAVCEQLRYLNMGGTVFTTAFTACSYGAAGGEKMEFLIAPNPGEPPRPLARIASGGELSRIMLAILTVLSRYSEVDTLVFDEIDAGVSGRAALRVGDRLKSIAAGRQVLCITHLAQIAAKANEHLLIEKGLVNGRAQTTVCRLTGVARERELARIIGGEQVTEASLQTARELMGK